MSGTKKGGAKASLFYFWTISNLVEKESGFLSEKDVFLASSPEKGSLLFPNGPMPGQKSIRLAKKGGDPPFPEAGFRRFSPGIPLPPHQFAETKQEAPGRFLPALFVFAACFLARQQGDGSERPTKSEMIHSF